MRVTLGAAAVRARTQQAVPLETSTVCTAIAAVVCLGGGRRQWAVVLRPSWRTCAPQEVPHTHILPSARVPGWNPREDDNKPRRDRWRRVGTRGRSSPSPVDGGLQLRAVTSEPTAGVETVVAGSRWPKLWPSKARRRDLAMGVGLSCSQRCCHRRAFNDALVDNANDATVMTLTAAAVDAGVDVTVNDASGGGDQLVRVVDGAGQSRGRRRVERPRDTNLPHCRGGGRDTTTR